MEESLIDSSREGQQLRPITTERFDSIQVLRGIAAVAVVLFHVREYMKVAGGVDDSIFRVFTEIFSSGATLFFCISGFLMAHLVVTQYKNFLPRRLLRIYPTYFVAVALTLIVEWWTFRAPPRPDILAALSLMPMGAVAYPLRIEWTLVYEVFFYLVCAIFTVGTLRRFFPVFLMAWLVVIGTATAIDYVPQTHLPTYDSIFFQWYNVYFIVGALVYYASRVLPKLPAAYCYMLLAVVVPTIGAWPLLKTNPIFWAYEKYILLGCITTILVVALSLSIRIPGRANEIAVKAGDYSYGIYLIHVPVMLSIIFCYKTQIGPPNSLVALLAFLASMVCGWYLGKLDVKIHRWITRHVFRVQRPVSVITEEKQIPLGSALQK